MLSDEAMLVVERENGRIATESILIQAAAGSIMSKDMGEVFQNLVESLRG